MLDDMFDSHCHLHDTDVIAHADVWVRRARDVGVTGFLLAGVDPDGWREEQTLAARHADVFMAFGLHPQVLAGWTEEQARAGLRALERAFDQESSGKLVALGEIGLDAHTPERKAALELQTRLFREQLALARARDVPVLLHILSAHGPALALLRQDGLPRRGGVVHSYSGSGELVRDYVGLGLHVSFAGTVTSERAKKTRGAAALVPPERLLVETDAPFQTPAEFRPEPNQPAFLPAIVHALAALRHEPAEALAQRTEANARALFGLG